MSRGEGSIYRISYANAPVLTILRSGADAVLAWPTSATGYRVQSAPSVGPTAVWPSVNDRVTVVNGQNQVTTAITGSAGFFRLVNP